jgi:hypothetical protein
MAAVGISSSAIAEFHPGKITHCPGRPDLVYVPNRLDSSDYSGDVLWRQPDTVQLSEANERRAVASPTGEATAGPGLSKGHIRPRPSSAEHTHLEIWHGAGAIKIVRPAPAVGSEPVARGEIAGFSRKSRKRMMDTLAKVRMGDDVELPLFVTLTFPDWVPDPEAALRAFDVWVRRLERRFGRGGDGLESSGVGVIWRKDVQIRKSGEVSKDKWVPHYHLLVWGASKRMPYEAEQGEWVTMAQGEDGGWVETVLVSDGKGGKVVGQRSEISPGADDRLIEWVSRSWYDVVGSGDVRHYRAGTNVQTARTPQGVRSYLAKYMAKPDEQGVLGSPYCLGRWWGVRGRKWLPWGRREVVRCTPEQAAKIVRVARRYMRSKSGRCVKMARGSFMLYINSSDQWVKYVNEVLKST